MDNGQWTCVAKRLSCIFLSIVSNEKLMAFCFTVRSYKRNMKRTVPYKIHNVILDRAKIHIKYISYIYQIHSFISNTCMYISDRFFSN